MCLGCTSECTVLPDIRPHIPTAPHEMGNLLGHLFDTWTRRPLEIDPPVTYDGEFVAPAYSCEFDWGWWQMDSERSPGWPACLLTIIIIIAIPLTMLCVVWQIYLIWFFLPCRPEATTGEGPPPQKRYSDDVRERP